MSTTRHLINRRRRLAAAPPSREAVRAAARERDPDLALGRDLGRDPDLDSDLDLDRERPARSATATRIRPRGAAVEPAAKPAPRPAAAGERAPRRSRLRLPAAFTVVLTLLTVLLGGLAAWSASKASALHDSAATGNTALTDTARTSEVKGAVTQAVNAVFSYDYAATARTDDAARRVLTGKAVAQYATMLAQVRAQAPAGKLVLTTTVTDTGVEMIDGDRARVLVFADQRNTSTAKSAGAAATTYAAAMFAVDAVHQGGSWKIASIDTFG